MPRGVYERTSEMRAAISAGQRGKKLSPETRARMSAANKGREITWGEKISASKLARSVRVECSIDGCEGIAAARGYCAKHYTRFMRHGDPMIRLPSSAELPAPKGADHPSWKGDDISYSGVHMRLQSHRGTAEELPCIDCGGPAAHWSFNHSTPAERTKQGSDGPYSASLNDWDPRCVPCHKRYDLDR